MQATKTASPAKLNDGSWGARTSGVPTSGDIITIKTRAGKTWQAKVKAVVWTNQTNSLVATERLDYAPARRTKRRFVPCGYPGCNSTYCDECDGEGMYG